MGTGTPCVKLAKEPTGDSPGRCISTKKRHEAQYPNQADAGNMKRRGLYPHRRTLYHRYFNFGKRESQVLLQKNENFFAGIYATVTKTLDSSLTREAHHDRIQALMTYSFHGDAQ